MLNAEQARNLSLPGGFDDFVLCPCAVEELSIRVRALGRRRARPGAPVLSNASGVLVDETSRTVFVDGHAVQLTAREFALFTYLCEWRGRVLSREHLFARVWGSRYSGGRRTVDIHVRRLRAKLGASLSIETLRGSGYRLQRHPLSDVLHDDALIGEDASAQMPEPFSKVS
jgi:DNA-binding response OmpR family regulator